jgi:hypothetical protein
MTTRIPSLTQLNHRARGRTGLGRRTTFSCHQWRGGGRASAGRRPRHTAARRASSTLAKAGNLHPRARCRRSGSAETMATSSCRRSASRHRMSKSNLRDRKRMSHGRTSTTRPLSSQLSRCRTEAKSSWGTSSTTAGGLTVRSSLPACEGPGAAHHRAGWGHVRPPGPGWACHRHRRPRCEPCRARACPHPRHAPPGRA